MDGTGAAGRLAIDDARCVHALAACATCRACVDICPRGAWQAHADGLVHDGDACDDCGLCVPACPTGALTLQPPVSLRVTPRAGAAGDEKGREAAMTCERTGIHGPSVTRVACVYVIDEAALLAWARAGVRRLVLLTGACESCPRARALETTRARVQAVSAVLHARRLPGIDVRRQRVAHEPRGSGAAADADADAAGTGAGAPPDAGPPRSSQGSGHGRDTDAASRRRFLLPLVASTAHRSSGDAGSRVRAVKALADLGRGPALWSIDVAAPERCNACDACRRLCPADAITTSTTRDEHTHGLWLEPARCIGCGLCIDACATSVLRAMPGQAPFESLRKPIALTLVNCRRCGQRYRESIDRSEAAPAGRPGAGVCPSCTRAQQRHPHRIVQR